MCYPIFCSEKSLTIQVYNQYIVCPREGGIVQIKGEYIDELVKQLIPILSYSDYSKTASTTMIPHT